MSRNTEFARWLDDYLTDNDDMRPADLARQTGIDASLISKWQRGAAVPSLANLRRLAPVVRQPLPALAALAGHLDVGEVARQPAVQAPPHLHELVRELSRLLPADEDKSPLPPDERNALESLIGHVISPYRHRLKRRRAG